MAEASFDILLVGQNGRIGYEALLCVASLRAHDPGFDGRVVVAEPQPGPLWSKDPRLPGHLRDALRDLGAELTPFDSHAFGETYPNGNKIEALSCLAPGKAFLFLDSDTFITGALSRCPLAFDRPAASPRVRDTWPKVPAYGPTRFDIWSSLYRLFDLDIERTLDPRFPADDRRHYLYCNAGWFFGPCGPTFGAKLTDIATEIRDHPPVELANQTLYPWLDQIALPLVLAQYGGRHPAPELDGQLLHHYRHLPLLFATGPDRTIAQLTRITDRNRVKKHLKRYAPFHRTLYRGGGEKARALFDRARLPHSETVIRNRLRRAGLWGR